MIIIVNRLFKQFYTKFINELTLERVVQIFYYFLWKIHDLFEIVVFDREIQFVNYFWKRLTQRLKFRVCFSIVWHSKIDEQSKSKIMKLSVTLKFIVFICKTIEFYKLRRSNLLLTITFQKSQKRRRFLSILNNICA